MTMEYNRKIENAKKRKKEKIAKNSSLYSVCTPCVPFGFPPPLSQFLGDVGCRMMILCVPFPKAAIDFARDKEIEEERRREIK